MLHYTALHCAAQHSSTLQHQHQLQLQMPLPLHLQLHYTTATLRLQFQLHYATLIIATTATLVLRHTNHYNYPALHPAGVHPMIIATTPKGTTPTNHLSVHQWVRSAISALQQPNLNDKFLSLKLLPPS